MTKNKSECSSNEYSSLLRIRGKVHGIVIIDVIDTCTESQRGDEQCGRP